MFIKFVPRFFHSSRALYAIDKTSLATLRKKTGYTFANCQKALQLHNNDVNKAEQWLKEQAQSLGWSKATKLKDRVTAQGLVGVLIRNNIGAMVEVNCETDFVARNEKFRDFVENASRVCAHYTEMTDFDGDLWKLGFEGEALKNLKLDDGSTLGDQLVALIGSVGENATVKRAICFKTNNQLKLAGYAHPSTSTVQEADKTHFGKYGAIVAFRSLGIDNLNDENCKNLCLHIVGMNPAKVGEVGRDEPAQEKDEEKCLIYQEYLLDSEHTVGEILKDLSVEIVDFQRFECGKVEENQSLDVAKFVN